MELSAVLQNASTEGSNVDYVVLLAAAAAAFFVVLAFIMLARYRRVSQRVASATDLGKGLYESLEGRLAKQDERILDVMTRMEVIQSRALEKARKTERYFSPLPPMVPQSQTSRPQNRVRMDDIDIAAGLAAPEAPAPSARPATQQAPAAVGVPQAQTTVTATAATAPVTTAPGAREQDSGEMRALKLLGEAPRTSVEIRDLTGLSREHAARIMKALFDRGLVTRDMLHKPYRYQLTDAGRSHVSAGS
jgi:hypothetical protein